MEHFVRGRNKCVKAKRENFAFDLLPQEGMPSAFLDRQLPM